MTAVFNDVQRGAAHVTTEFEEHIQSTIKAEEDLSLSILSLSLSLSKMDRKGKEIQTPRGKKEKGREGGEIENNVFKVQKAVRTFLRCARQTWKLAADDEGECVSDFG